MDRNTAISFGLVWLVGFLTSSSNCKKRRLVDRNTAIKRLVDRSIVIKRLVDSTKTVIKRLVV